MVNNTDILNKNPLRLLWIGVLLVVLVTTSYSLFTDHTWEDYYITYRPSKNLAMGNGLVYQLGERVHTFTSPLNVLVPAAISRVTGNFSDKLTLWIFRFISIALLGGAWVFLARSFLRIGIKDWSLVFLAVLFSFECKLVAFSTNGQESGFMLFFIASTIYSMTTGKRRWLWLGLSFAGLMYTRPDGFIYGGAVAAGLLLFPPPDKSPGRSRVALLKDLAIGGVLALLIYAPWVIFAWAYYGSPVPHTIIAKGMTSGAASHPWHILQNLFHFPFDIILKGSDSSASMLGPIYRDLGGWHYSVLIFGQWTGALATLYWIFPLGRWHTRALSFACFLSHFYLTHIAAYPAQWYLPSATILGIAALALIISDLVLLRNSFQRRGKAQKASYVHVVTVGAASIISAVVLVLFFCTAWEMRNQQRIIEEGHRKQIGLWLKDHAKTPTDTVFLEPLGYIGFFSGLKMYDCPGLSSLEVVQARRKVGDNWILIIRLLHPDWLVLRPEEEAFINKYDPQLLRNDYEKAMRFDVSSQVDKLRPMPGLGYLQGDQTFIIYHRLANKTEPFGALPQRRGQ